MWLTDLPSCRYIETNTRQSDYDIYIHYLFGLAHWPRRDAEHVKGLLPPLKLIQLMSSMTTGLIL